MKNEWRILAAVCAVVVGIYACTAHDGHVTQSSLDAAASSYYNLLVQGFRAGHLSLKKEVPPALAQLADPYAPTPLHAFGAWDLSYYRDKLYLYFGVTPAVVLFWPYVALTGHYLFYCQAMTIFCAVGFLASMGVLVGLWRRYFAEVSVAVVAAGGLALGLATFIPSLLARCEVWEVPIGCGYMLTMLALGAIWYTLHEPERRWQWLAAASAAYGLAVGARPSLASGAIILLVPVAQAWQERRKIWALLLAATGPIILIGFGLMLYNVQRFDDPFEFGIHYQITVRSQIHEQLFGVHNLWLHFRAYSLETAQWSGHFPFVQRAKDNHTFGVLTNIPLAWVALAVPLAWRRRVGPAESGLRWFVIAVAVLFGMCALTLGLYYFVALRYEVEFLPALVLLAVIGILSLERALACQPLWRRVARWGYGLLLAFSVAFNLFASVVRCAEADNELGILVQGAGQVQEAVRHYEQALRLNPDFADAHRNLGNALMQTGRIQEAIAHYEQALRTRPDFFEANNNLGNALLQSGRIQEAIEQFQQALHINPDFADAHCNLGNVFLQEGKIEEAIAHYEQALRIKPDLAEAHNSLGAALYQTGRREEAIEHFLQALAIKPDYAEAHSNLGSALAEIGKIEQAIARYEQALRIKPDYAEAHYNLGSALEQAGRGPEAIQHYQQALKLRPDFAPARNALARLQAGQ
ncbi:MAG: tetratricopeptide repeat protein [Verrucomicrobiia bacterium]|jgi:tetratricopeptide (TPR) repeat protein